jgi:hypothetical protein
MITAVPSYCISRVYVILFIHCCILLYQFNHSNIFTE